MAPYFKSDPIWRYDESMRCPGSRGFSLIEVMISSLLFGLGVAALVQLFTSSSGGLRMSRNRAVATQLALQRLEQLAALDAGLVPQCAPSNGCQEDFSTLAEPQPAAGGFDCTMVVQDGGFAGEQAADPAGAFRVDVATDDHPDPNQIAGARLLRVSVCWSDNGSGINQVQLERLVVPEV
jgi:prepilin-type N-terminal cleavage/methylation domain-containing protein